MKDGLVKWAGGRRLSADEGLRMEGMRVEGNEKKRGRKMTVEEVFYGGCRGQFVNQGRSWLM
jgi:hypothetical protein